MRLLLVPGQLVLVLLILYVAIDVPSDISLGQNVDVMTFFNGFAQMVANDFTGNWGTSASFQYPGVPMVQLYAWLLPNSVELAVFALGFSAAIAYPLSMVLGWSRRPGVDFPARFVSLVGTLLPVMVVGSLVISALFFWFINNVGDLPDQGVIPSFSWWVLHYEGYPSWVIYTSITQPTGFPLVDGLVQRAWAFEEITLLKTLLQAAVIAAVYVTIFLRHSRSVVADASRELHLTAARSRGIKERTLLWRHTARRVRPTFFIVFALTLPAYLGTQFVVEAVFLDRGVGWLALTALTGQMSSGNGIQQLEVMMFLLSVVVLVWLSVVDIIAKRLDPREVQAG